MFLNLHLSCPEKHAFTFLTTEYGIHNTGFEVPMHPTHALSRLIKSYKNTKPNHFMIILDLDQA